ncbi:MAG: hypothetical protein CMN16_18025 [Roseovarius sp.]|nr:hypothetical protein [Roseovarius sp.]|tara:strand:- start:254 stop:469 length:216 start_codon:yes stop_codon:yes gene_type:complete
MSTSFDLRTEEFRVLRDQLEDFLKTIEEMDDIILPASVPETLSSHMDVLIIRLRDGAEKMLSFLNVTSHGD